MKAERQKSGSRLDSGSVQEIKYEGEWKRRLRCLCLFCVRLKRTVVVVVVVKRKELDFGSQANKLVGGGAVEVM